MIQSGNFLTNLSRIATPYVNIPPAPFTTGYARPVAGLGSAGQIAPSDLGNTGPLDVILDGNFNAGILLNTLIGARGNEYRFTNKDSTFIAGLSTSTTFHSFGTVNNSNYIGLYGKDANTPMFCQAGVGMSMLGWLALTGEGSTIRLINILGTNIGYTSVLASTGDFTVPTLHRKVVTGFLRIDGIVGEGEGTGYIGHNGSPWGYTGVAVSFHNASKDKGREGFQHQHVKQGLVYNQTHVNSGQSGIGGQTNLYQLHNCAKHVVENMIFDGAPIPHNLFTHDTVLRNCYIRFQSAAGFIGRTDNAYFAGSLNLNGIKFLFVDCDIVYDDGAGGTIATFTDVAERTADIEVRTSNIQKITALYNDVRVAGFINTLIGTPTTNGNAISTTIPKPEYLSIDPLSIDYLKLNVNTAGGLYHYNKGRGYRTPAPAGALVIVEALEVIDQSNPIKASWLEVNALLPTTIQCRLQNGLVCPLPVTWAMGAWTAGVPATYMVYGTLTPTAGNVNTYNIIAEQNITVNPAPTVKINLGFLGMDYTATGNWNHVEQSGTGAQQNYGNNHGQPLSFLRDTDGVATSWNVTINSFMQGEGNGPTGAGTYPAAANKWEWTSFAGGRSLKVTGLTTGRQYNFKILCGVLAGLGGFSDHSVDINVSGGTGGSGGGNFTGNLENGNVTNLINGSGGINVVAGTAGEVTIIVTPNVHSGCINVIEITA